MIGGAFGSSAFSFVSQNFKTFADNILSTGYGCGTFGQSEPKYGVACTTTTSVVVPGSSPSSQIASSSSSIILLSSSQISSSSNLLPSSSSSTVSINSSSSYKLSSLGISSSSNISSSTTIINPPTLSVKINLSANYNNSTKQMGNDFRARNMIPLTQPYSQAPFNYSGLESYSNLANIPTSTVDWVLIEIKDISKNSVFTKAAILRQDGNVIDTNGLQIINLTDFNPISGYSYQVVVRHRNSLAIATNQNISFAPNINTTVDFTKNINVKGSNQESIGTDNLDNQVFGLRKANTDGNGSVIAADRQLSLNAQESSGIYSANDVNLDGDVTASDRQISTNAPESNENI